MREYRKNFFITNNDQLKSFSLRASAIVVCKDQYLMVLNEAASKYKHPGGHIQLNESLIEGLKRELNEEISLNIEEISTEGVFFDCLFKNQSAMINAIFQIDISLEIAQELISNSPLQAKLFRLNELNQENTWKSEINAIKYYESHITLG